MKHLSELLPSTARIATASEVKQNTSQAGSMVEAGSKMTRLEQSRQEGKVDQAMVARLANRLLSKSLWQTELTDDERKKRVMLLEETVTLPSYDDAAILIARFTAHFPKRDESERAVVIGDIAAACERNGISLMGLAVALIEIVENARADNPFMPPTGEILERARMKSTAFRSCLANDLRKLSQ